MIRINKHIASFLLLIFFFIFAHSELDQCNTASEDHESHDFNQLTDETIVKRNFNQSERSKISFPIIFIIIDSYTCESGCINHSELNPLNCSSISDNYKRLFIKHQALLI